MKYTIDSALRRVKNHGIGAYGARDFLRRRGLGATVDRRKAESDNRETEAKRTRVDIVACDNRCIKFAH